MKSWSEEHTEFSMNKVFLIMNHIFQNQRHTIFSKKHLTSSFLKQTSGKGRERDTNDYFASQPVCLSKLNPVSKHSKIFCQSSNLDRLTVGQFSVCMQIVKTWQIKEGHQLILSSQNKAKQRGVKLDLQKISFLLQCKHIRLQTLESTRTEYNSHKMAKKYQTDNMY